MIRKKALITHLQERAIAFGDAETAALPRGTSSGAPQKADPRKLTATVLQGVLSRTGGNRSAAARELGIARNTLTKKMRDFGLGDDDPYR